MRIALRCALALAVTSIIACKKDKPAPEVQPTAEAGSGATTKPTPPALPDAAAPVDPYAALAVATDACEGKTCAQLALPATKDDPAKAMSLFKKGCETGDGISCAMVGMGFEQGMGVTADGKVAVMLYDKSCTLGYAKGCHNLGLLLANGGNGVETDLPRAVIVLEKACKGEAWKACGSVGDYYLTQGDKAKALPLLELGCKNEDQLSCDTLAKAK